MQVPGQTRIESPALSLRRSAALHNPSHF